MTEDPATLHKDMLQRMWLIRSFEERVIELIHRKQLGGLVHVGIGQEGVAVGDVQRPAGVVNSSHLGELP